MCGRRQPGESPGYRKLQNRPSNQYKPCVVRKGLGTRPRDAVPVPCEAVAECCSCLTGSTVYEAAVE